MIVLVGCSSVKDAYEGTEAEKGLMARKGELA
jgi:hypothetical protein